MRSLIMNVYNQVTGKPALYYYERNGTESAFTPWLLKKTASLLTLLTGENVKLLTEFTVSIHTTDRHIEVFRQTVLATCEDVAKSETFNDYWSSRDVVYDISGETTSVFAKIS